VSNQSDYRPRTLSSPDQPQGELNLARVAWPTGSQAGERLHGIEDFAEGGRRKIALRSGEIRPVEEVEHLGPKLESLRFPQAKPAQDGKSQSPRPGPRRAPSVGNDFAARPNSAVVATLGATVGDTWQSAHRGMRQKPHRRCTATALTGGNQTRV